MNGSRGYPSKLKSFMFGFLAVRTVEREPPSLIIAHSVIIKSSSNLPHRHRHHPHPSSPGFHRLPSPLRSHHSKSDIRRGELNLASHEDRVRGAGELGDIAEHVLSRVGRLRALDVLEAVKLEDRLDAVRRLGWVFDNAEGLEAVGNPTAHDQRHVGGPIVPHVEFRALFIENGDGVRHGGWL